MKIIYSPFPSLNKAKEIAKQLLVEKKAFCINIIPGCSLFLDDDAIIEAEEVYMLIKVPGEIYPELVSRLTSLHPYDIPCIIVLSASANHQYLDWLNSLWHKLT